MGRQLQNPLPLCTALIRPILEYGSKAFDSASPTTKEKLNSIQYQALKICCGAIQGSPLYQLQIECGDPPLELRRKFLSTIYKTKIKSHQNHPNQCTIKDNWQKHYFSQKWITSHKTPFEARAKESTLLTYPTNNPFPYWKYNKPIISTEILPLTINAINPKEKYNISMEIINNKWQNSLCIYTDGSYNPSFNTAGCGICIPQLKYYKNYRLNNEISIFSAELLAILFTLEWIENVKPIQTCILSDCLSALQAISKHNPQNKIICDIRYTLINILQQRISVIFEWIPGHCGIPGNEKADQLAKSATQKKIIDYVVPLSNPEVKKQLKEQIKIDWQNNIPIQDNFFKIKYDPLLNFTTWDLKRPQEVTLHRIRLGICKNLKNFQYKIGNHPNGLCETCKIPDNISHFMLHCLKYKKQRETLIKNTKSRQDITLTQLLNKKENYHEILKFLKNCNVQI